MRKPKESDGGSASIKVALRAELPGLINRASSSPEAAQAVLRACAILHRKPPSVLVTKDNILGALSANEIPKSLEYLSKSENYLDVSDALIAFRQMAKQQLTGTLDRNTITVIGKTFASKLTKMATPGLKKKTVKSKLGPEKPPLFFTKETVSATADVVLWIVPRLFESQSRSRRSVTPLVVKLVRAFELVWYQSSRSETALIGVSFVNSLRQVLSKSSYSELEDGDAGAEQGADIATFVRETNSALLEAGRLALLEGRLRELQASLRVIKGEHERNRFLSELRELCNQRPTELVPEAIEWVARQIENRRGNVEVPVAADESQSSALHYVAAVLLTAWDASHEGAQSKRSLETVQKLAREVFKVDLAGTPGEVVVFDERLHELHSDGRAVPSKVELVRPGVRWSDGVRTRFLLRAIVKPFVESTNRS